MKKLILPIVRKGKDRLGLLVILGEAAVLFGFGSSFLVHAGVDFEAFFIYWIFLGVLFSSFYGLVGACVGVVFSLLCLSLVFQRDIIYILMEDYLYVILLVSTSLLVGITRSRLDMTISALMLQENYLKERMKKLAVELSIRDESLREALEEIFTDTESPQIVYQDVRNLGEIKDEKELFAEVFYIFYKYCYVEAASFYRPAGRLSLKRVAKWGTSTLPDELSWEAKEMPDILRVVLKEKKLLVPKFLGNKFVLAVPFLLSNGELKWILAIEEIKFLMFSENVVKLCQAIALWVKAIVEKKLFVEEMRRISVFRDVVVYNKEYGREELGRLIKTYRELKLSYALGIVRGKLTEEDVKALRNSLRDTDEMFYLDESSIIVFLPMCTSDGILRVKERIKRRLPQVAFEELTDDGLDRIYFLGDK